MKKRAGNVKEGGGAIAVREVNERERVRSLGEDEK